MPALSPDAHRILAQTSLPHPSQIVSCTLPLAMSWVRSILQCCGIDSSWAQPGSKAKRDLDALTDFDGEMPSYEEKGGDDKIVSG
jgi:hypothetical protein